LQLLVELIMVLRASIVAAVFAFGVTGAAFAQPAPAWGNPSPVVEVDGLKLAYAKNKHRHYGWSRGRHYRWYRGHPRSYRVTRYRRYAPRYYGYRPGYYGRPVYYGRHPYYRDYGYYPYRRRPGVTVTFGGY
jgi:hypothetical protein